MAGSSDQLKEQLKAAQAGEQEAKRLLAAGERVLTRVKSEAQAVLGRQIRQSTPWLTERHGYDPTYTQIIREKESFYLFFQNLTSRRPKRS